MFEFQNLFDPILIIMLIIFTGFSIYVYKATNPPAPKNVRRVLASLRGLAFFLLLLAIFNSVIGFSRAETKSRANLFFIDNSESITLKDSAKRARQISKFITDFNFSDANRFLTFGSKIEPVGNAGFLFNQTSTCFEDIEKYISEQSADIASVTILSDGIITEGANPLYGFEKEGIPVFTVAIGDTAEQNDIYIEEPVHNELIYKGRKTPVEARILNNGFADKTVTVKLFDENALVEQKNISLSKTGIDNISFDYAPKSTGERRLTVSVPPLKGENSIHNNSRSFMVKVLNDKIKAFLVSGAPSPDVAIITGILSKNERIKLKSIIELGGAKQIKGGSSDFPADSADFFLLLGYPSPSSNPDLFRQVKTMLLTKHKPVILLPGGNTDIKKLEEINSLLPFTIGSVSPGELQIEVYGNSRNNSLIKDTDIKLWELLPPVSQMKTRFEAKPGSDILLKAKINNTETSSPVIISRQNGENKVIAVLADNIWKWGLQSNSKLDFLLDSFFSNSVQWLNTPSGKKLFSVKTNKRVYSLGEKIEITCNLYDDLFNPLENADIKIDVLSPDNKYQLTVPDAGNGVYKTSLEKYGPGNLKIRGLVRTLNRTLTDSLSIYVDKNEVEKINTKADTGFLRQLSKATKGSYFIMNDYAGLKAKIESAAAAKRENLKKSFEIRFSSSEIILIIIILLFTIEWVIRKIYRLI